MNRRPKKSSTGNNPSMMIATPATSTPRQTGNLTFGKVPVLAGLIGLILYLAVSNIVSYMPLQSQSLLAAKTTTVAIKASSVLAIPLPEDYPFAFSACLIIKDDNRILPEWLAYHYTVMPLRDLIVAVDPLSASSPETILDKFRELGMNITLWEDKDYNFKRSQTPDSDSYDKIQEFIDRQLLFYQQCLIELKSREGGHTWTMMIDADEYVTFNHYHESEGRDSLAKLDPIDGHPDYYEKLKKYDGIHNSLIDMLKSGEHPRAKLPIIGEVTVAKYIASQAANKTLWETYPCINIPRITFGFSENALELDASQFPIGLDPLSFQTIRDRHHQHRFKNAGKSIVDASQYDGIKPESCHRVMNKKCYPSLYPWFRESTLRVHHYTGSLEDFIRIGTNIRGEEKFKEQNNLVNRNLNDDSLKGWLLAFVDIVGKEKAHEVTEKLREWAIANNRKISKEIENGNFTYPFYKP